VRDVSVVGNCSKLGPESWGARLDQRGLDWQVHHSSEESGLRSGDPVHGNGRARLGIWNRSTLEHRLEIKQVMACSATQCLRLSWTALDRKLSPGQNVEIEIDARTREAPREAFFVVSLVGTVDGKWLCHDVAAWMPMTGEQPR
jgi:hypothetical protein